MTPSSLSALPFDSLAFDESTPPHVARPKLSANLEFLIIIVDWACITGDCASGAVQPFFFRMMILWAGE